MTKVDKLTIVDTYEDYYFAIINEHGVILYTNDQLAQCLYIEESTGAALLKETLQRAGFVANPSYLKMNLLNSTVHKAYWHIARLKSTRNKPEELFICIGHKTEIEKPTYTPAPGVLVMDCHGHVIDINEKATTLLNMNPESLLSNPQIADFCSPFKIFTDPISFEDSPLMNTLLAGKPYEQVIEMRADSPDSKWLQFTFYPLFDDNESVPFSFVTLVNELPWHKEPHTCDKDLFQKELLNLTSAMTWLIDDQERLIFANPAFLRFLGMKENDLNKKAVDVIPPFFTAIFEKAHRNVLATGIAHKKIYKHPLADGTTSYFLVNIFPVPHKTNKRLLGGEAMDITFGYNVHEEIARANDRLIRLTQVSTDAIWEWDLQTNQVFRSKQLLELIGTAEIESPANAWWHNRVHPDDKERIELNVKNLFHNQSSWQWEYRLKYLDGAYRTVRDRGIVVFENEKPVKLIGSVLDLTEIKELENLLLQEKIKHQKEIAKSIIDTQEKNARALVRSCTTTLTSCYWWPSCIWGF